MVNLKIATRLNFAFGGMVILVLVVGLTGLFNAHRINAGSVEVGRHWLPNMQVMAELRASANGARRDALALTAADEQRRRVLNERRKKAMDQRLLPLLDAYSKRLSEPEERRLFEEMSSKLNASIALDDKLVDLVMRSDGQDKEIDRLATGASDVAFVDYTKALTELSKLNDDAVAAEAARAQQTYDSAVKWSCGLIALSAILAVWLVRAIKRSVMRPLASAIAVAETVSGGNLTMQIEASGTDEMSQLLEALSTMSSNLARIVTDVRQRSEAIAAGSSQIATGNVDLSQRTEQQASSLQETAAAMEQLMATVKTTAETAHHADGLASAASAAAVKGGDVVAQVVQTMQDIAASSSRIADITSVIDGIAFQTNILALNAAVEAARAGEHGRGFAVVAAEVRTLAQRSANAAKEIKSLIGASVNRVEAGSRQAEAAGESMQEIVDQAQRVSGLIAEISAAASEQTAGIGQVGTAVSQLDQVTQQNAALVEQSAAASDSLRTQAAALSDLVAVFKTSPSVDHPSKGEIEPMPPKPPVMAAVAPSMAPLRPARNIRETLPAMRTAVAPAAARIPKEGDALADWGGLLKGCVKLALLR